MQEAVPSTEKKHPLSANWLIGRLTALRLVSFTDSSGLERALETEERKAALIQNLACTGRAFVEVQSEKTVVKAQKIMRRLQRVVPGLGLGEAA